MSQWVWEAGGELWQPVPRPRQAQHQDEAEDDVSALCHSHQLLITLLEALVDLNKWPVFSAPPTDSLQWILLQFVQIYMADVIQGDTAHQHGDMKAVLACIGCSLMRDQHAWYISVDNTHQKSLVLSKSWLFSFMSCLLQLLACGQSPVAMISNFLCQSHNSCALQDRQSHRNTASEAASTS